MRDTYRCLKIAASAGICGVLFLLSPGLAKDPEWSVDRAHRVLVRVDAADIGQRERDISVASLDIDFAKFFDGRADLASLVVNQYDPETGQTIEHKDNAYAELPGERPIRFYDAKIPWDFPDYEGYVNFETGLATPVNPMEGGGRFFNVIGDSRAGKVAWVHHQLGRNEHSFYAIYFNELPDDGLATQAKPGLLGDGANRFIKNSSEFAPIIHGRSAVGDFNGDGKFDLVLGNLTGTVFLYENSGGGKEGPKFGEPLLLFTDDGNPIDVGWAASPTASDWDGDGLLDLIIGAEKETVLFYKNVGTTKKPAFRHMGIPLVDGKPLRIPRQPTKEDPENKIYPRDYNAMPDIADWNGDGALDLLVGGYITGVMFYYENTAPAGSPPQLTYKGIIQADGKDADVGWVATPCVVDLNGDGKLDLLSGAMQISEDGADAHDQEKFLWYFENVGTREKPELAHRPFPKEGKFRYGALGAPRAVDFNDDGLVDLIVTVSSHLMMYANIGTKSEPKFDATIEPVVREMGNGSIGFDDLLDYDGDGWPDQFGHSTIRLNDGFASPGLFSKNVPLPGAEKILHRSPRGDHWDQRILADMDGDGALDILLGDHPGNIWFHRNTGTKSEPKYDVDGAKLQHADGKPIRVGIPPGEAAAFDVLQGARTHMTAFDADHDGSLDLVGADTFGRIYFFPREPGGKLAFKPAVELESAMPGVRLMVRNVDWNDDGWQDVLAVYASGRDTFVLLNEEGAGGQRTFSSAQRIKIPPCWGDGFTYVADWNQDGDQDLVITGYGYLRFAERSYLQRGYAPATEIKYSKSGKMPGR